MLKSVGMSWKVTSSMQIDCCGWPQVKWLATIWLFSHVWFAFYFILLSDGSFFIALYWVCNSKSFGLTIFLDFSFMIYLLPLSASAGVWTSILTRIYMERGRERERDSPLCWVLVVFSAICFVILSAHGRGTDLGVLWKVASSTQIGCCGWPSRSLFIALYVTLQALD